MKVQGVLWHKFNILWTEPFEGRGSHRPRQRIFSGIHRQCHREKTCPPPLSKNKTSLTCHCSIWRNVPISLPLYQILSVSSQTFSCIHHMRFGVLVWWGKLWDFLISLWALSDKFLSLTLFPFSLYPINWLADIKPLPSWQYFIWIFSTLPVSFNQQLSATSTLDTLYTRRS